MMVKEKSGLALTVILISSALSACSGNSQPDATKTGGNQATVVSSNGNAAVNNTVPAGSPPASTPAVGNSPAAVGNQKSAPSVPMPSPQIGSGSSDMFLFTQARGALGSDQELLNRVVIEIKEGNATLTGSVSSQAQKTKAAQLVQGVDGIKSVKNNLQISQ